MLKILWKRGEIAPEEQFFLLSTIFCCLMLDIYVKTGIGFSLRDKRLFEITEVEIISMFHGCMVWIEKSVTRVTDRHHEACRVMPNSDPK